MDSRTVKAFYDRFPYPPAPDTYARLLDDPWLFAKAIGQETGRRGWRPRRIWVAGCGAMQALNTALAFPESEVLGTDISEEQLKRCLRDAQQVGASNLHLELFDLSTEDWEHKFDYVLCTGVIHHMSKPAVGLLKLQKALVPDGLLELMVYHSYHVEKFAAFADAIRTLLGTRDAPDFEREWKLARGLMGDGGVPDTLIHPVIRRYTMRSLSDMVSACALRFVQPRHAHESKGATWSVFKGGEEWERISELERWTVSSELQFDKAPMLWFYLERSDSALLLFTGRELDEAFTKAEKRPFEARLRPFVRNSEGRLVEGMPIQFPPPPPLEYTSRLQLATQANAYLEVL